VPPVKHIILKAVRKDYQVKEGERVNLTKWPTLVEPVYKSKKPG
jgi:hypothetical protein